MQPLRLLVPPLLVAGVTLVGLAVRADTTVGALLLLLGVVTASLLGRASGVLGALLGTLSLSYFFTVPRGRFSVDDVDSLAALITFAVVALVVGTLVTRAQELQRRGEQREREATIRYDLARRINEGESVEQVLAATVQAMVEMFRLTSCTIRASELEAHAEGPGEPGAELVIDVPPNQLVVRPSARHPLSTVDVDVLRSLASSMGAALARVALERVAAEARIEAEVARTRAAFFAAAGHNLRTPLATISASASALRDAADVLEPEERRELLESIRTETDRLHRLLTKVLSLSRIRAGALQLQLGPVDLQGLVQATIGRLGPLAHEHRFVLDLPAAAGALQLDPILMEQLLLNLLENAVQHAPAGTEIEVRAALTDDHVELRVVDHGPGIPTGLHDAVFEEFVRANSRPDTEGTGLGLAIVRSLARAQGGEAWSETTPGGGATMVLRFPVGTDDRPGGPGAAMPLEELEALG